MKRIRTLLALVTVTVTMTVSATRLPPREILTEMQGERTAQESRELREKVKAGDDVALKEVILA